MLEAYYHLSAQMYESIAKESSEKLVRSRDRWTDGWTRVRTYTFTRWGTGNPFLVKFSDKGSRNPWNTLKIPIFCSRLDHDRHKHVDWIFVPHKNLALDIESFTPTFVSIRAATYTPFTAASTQSASLPPTIKPSFPAIFFSFFQDKLLQSHKG